MRLYKLFALLLVFTITVGGIATVRWWLSSSGSSEVHLIPWIGVSLIAACLTLTNILVRWVKWRFLCRRNGIRVPAKKGLGVYLATLPAILTPFYVGELIRIPLLGLPVRSGFSRLFRIFILERGADVVALTFLIFFGNLPVAFVLILVFIIIPFVHKNGRRRGWSVAVVLSVFAWSLPVISLAAFEALFGYSVGLKQLAVLFGKSTLLGGATGLPMGAGVTGSSMLSGLLGLEITQQNAIWIIAGFRLATTWFALGVGVISMAVYAVRLKSGKRESNHFDTIADQYEDEIPEYIQEHLLHRKVGAILETLGGVEGKDGLDVGCGQGYYTLQFAEKGARMVGVDLSAKQLQWAQHNAEKADADAEWKQATADKLPFPDRRFDFVYCVNMLHHMESRVAQEKALQEMGRILRPGGRIFVHEMNTLNPLFRFYMSYLFPVINAIDEGTEWWLKPDELPPVEGGLWDNKKQHFTFIPDFISLKVWKLVRPIEVWLERSRWSTYSAHFMAVWKKHDDG